MEEMREIPTPTVTMPLMTRFMEEKLIDIVSEKRYLYDKNHYLYRNILMKDNTWKEIAELLGVSAEAVKNKWSSLRDMYIRGLRRQNKQLLENRAGVGGTNTISKCKHFDRLSFLKDMYTPRKKSPHPRPKQKKPIDYQATKIEIFSDESFDIAADTNIEEITTFEHEPASAEPQLVFEEEVPSSSKLRRKSKPSATVTAPDEKTSVGEEMLKMIKDIRGESRQDDISAFTANLDELIRQANFSVIERVEIQIQILNLVQECINKKKIKNDFY